MPLVSRGPSPALERPPRRFPAFAAHQGLSRGSHTLPPLPSGDGFPPFLQPGRQTALDFPAVLPQQPLHVAHARPRLAPIPRRWPPPSVPRPIPAPDAPPPAAGPPPPPSPPSPAARRQRPPPPATPPASGPPAAAAAAAG